MARGGRHTVGAAPSSPTPRWPGPGSISGCWRNSAAGRSASCPTPTWPPRPRPGGDRATVSMERAAALEGSADIRHRQRPHRPGAGLRADGRGGGGSPPWSSACRWGLSTWWRARSCCSPPPRAHSWPGAERAAATWRRPSATRLSISRPGTRGNRGGRRAIDEHKRGLAAPMS